MIETTGIFITNHAYERAKERLGWNNRTLDKMAQKAYNEGISHSDTKGSLKKYITKLFFEYKKANNIRIYGLNIYFFANNGLITLYQIPNNLKKLVKKSTT